MSDISDIKDVGGWITYFTFYSTVVLNFAIFLYVAFYDYVFINLYNVAAIIDARGFMIEGFLELIEFGVENSQIILSYFDYFWLVGFLTMCIILFVASYHIRRPNYFSLLFYIMYGIMIILFILSIVLQITGWWNQVFLNGILSNISVQLPFYNLYLQNVGIVNSIILVLCIILNMLDFDLITYGLRKQQDRISFEGRGGDEI